MKITNEKLERLRKLIGGRRTALSASDQKKWWNDNIFKCGPGKDISVEDYICHLEEDVAKKAGPTIKGWFNFFTTQDYLKKNLIIGEDDFIRFWSILVGVEESHSKDMYIRHFPKPVTMASFLEDFVAFLSNPDFFDEYSQRVYSVIKLHPRGICDLA